MKTFDTASFPLSAEQQAMLDELYPVINDEFKHDPKIMLAFDTASLQPNPKTAFVTSINPLVIKMAHDLGSTLNIMLAAIVSRTIANEWLEVLKDRVANPNPHPKEEPVYGMLPAMATSVEVDPHLNGIEERKPGASLEALRQSLRQTVASEDDTILPTSVPQNRLARGSAGQDRSKPILTVAVLRGLKELLNAELTGQLKGRPDARLAVKYLKRMVSHKEK